MQTQRMGVWTWGKEAGTNWESNIDIYTLPCLKQIAGGKLLLSTGGSAWPAMACRGGRGQRGRLSREGTLLYSRFTLLYIRN